MESEKDQPQYTPQELAGQFAKLVDNLPHASANPFQTEQSLTDELIKRMRADDKRIRNSEHRKVLFKKLQELLLHAPITDSFRAHIIHDFSVLYLMRLSTDERNRRFVNGYEGIFDPERAQEVENRFLSRQFSVQLGILKYATDRGLTPPDPASSEAFLNALIPGVHPDVSFTTWQQDFIKHYGIEPSLRV